MTRLLPLSKGCQYALRAVAILSLVPQGRVISRRELSRQTGAPSAFLSKILQVLTRTGLLRSHRGFQRGYSLARSSRRITVSDVVEAYDGALSHDACVLDGRRLCPGERVCALHKRQMRLQKQLAAHLSAVDISDVGKTLVTRTVRS